MFASLLALFSAAAWGASDYLGGRVSASLGVLRVLTMSQAVSFTLLAGTVAVVDHAWPPSEMLAPAVFCGLCEAVGIAALYRGLAVGAAGVVSPASAASPAVPLLAGFVLGQVPGPVRSLGLVITLAGIVVTALEPTAGGRAAVISSLGYGLLSALGFGGYFVAMDIASSHGVLWSLLLARGTSLLLVMAVLAVRGTTASVPSRAMPRLVAIGLVVMAADAAYAASTTLGILSLVAVLGAIHPVITIVLSRLLAAEHLSSLRWSGVVITLVGVTVTVM